MIIPTKMSQLTTALTEVAAALNKLGDLGERVDVRFGSIMTDYGYVLCDDDGRWSAKMKVGEPPAWWGVTVRHESDDE